MSEERGAAQRIEILLRAGRANEAARAAALALQRTPRASALHELMARAVQALGDFRTMLGAAQALNTLLDAPVARLLRIEALLLTGDKAEARAQLDEEERRAADDCDTLLRVAEFHGQCAAHERALGCYRRAAALRPADPKVLYSLAASLVANGALAEGEQSYTRVLELDPADADARYNLATVRRWSAGDNHVDALRTRLQAQAAGSREEVALCYALAKELEDLGEYQDSFAVLQRGAGARRQKLAYRVQEDIDAMRALRTTFTPELLARAAPPDAEPGPVFVLGLPRSGTTLLERILAAHPEVAALGEINDLALALINTLGRSAPKLELIERSARADFGALGARYLRATRGYGREAALLVDKTPLNFLYIGLIRFALPGARVIHLRRDPMDSCLAMYKTLFRMGYPFSYELGDLARYHAAHERLMQHWHALCPGFVLEVDYEALVAEPRAQTARVLEFCGLGWEERCRDFHALPGAAATASAAQVREPIHDRSVGRWRRNAHELAPLVDALQRARAVEEACA